MYRVLSTQWGGVINTQPSSGPAWGGLCAARVLADVSERVTVYERDELPDGPVNRTAVPQGRHVHLLMARGAQEFESLFPGLLDDMVADGVPILENRPDCIHFGAAGHVLGTAHRLQDEFTAYVPSRPQLEWQIRRRVMAIENVEIIGAGVTEPTYDTAQGRVTGVLLDSGDAVPADFVVDATGRGTRLPAWLDKWGYQRPREETVDVGIAYTSHQFHVPEGLLAEKVVVAGASRAQPVGIGMLFYEDGNWNVTTFGVAKVEPSRPSRRSSTWPTTSCPHMCRPRCGKAHRSARWRFTNTRPAGGAAMTIWSAFPQASSPSATPW